MQLGSSGLPLVSGVSRLIIVCTLLLLCGIPAAGQDNDSDEVDREALSVTDYKNLTLVVLEMDPNSAKVTQDAVRTEVEAKMKAAGITPTMDANDRFLYVFVHIDGAAFNIDIGFYREASWNLPDGKTIHNFLETWNSGHTLGTHRDSSEYVLAALDARLDLFLEAYVKANGSK